MYIDFLWLVSNFTVSIHAPAKGQQSFSISDSRLSLVSIHAPAKGQQIRNNAPQKNNKFQFMPPRRGNVKAGEQVAVEGRFQFMPPRRGNAHKYRYIACLKCFNSCPREGATVPAQPRAGTCKVSIHAPAKGQPITSFSPYCNSVFQFMPPRRGNEHFRFQLLHLKCFNSCPREGATYINMRYMMAG